MSSIEFSLGASGSRRPQGGFTLIELMITVAIVAILSAIAYPSYQNYLIKGRRASAQSVLMNVAQQQQQYFLDVRSYASSVTGTASLNVTIPSDVSSFYTVTLAVGTGTFTATAQPLTGTNQSSDGALTIDNTGAKTGKAW